MDRFACLAIETSTDQGTVAVSKGTHREQIRLAEGMASSRVVFTAARQLLEAADLSVRDLDCIACGNGPGSFTGVRVAVSAAQGLAFAARKPVCAVSSLQLLAAAGRHAQGTQVAACLDARMGQAYVGVYKAEADNRWVVELADQLVEPESFRLKEAFPDAVPVGAGWAAWSAMLTGHAAEVPPAQVPEATTLLELAAARFEAGEHVNAPDALPNYIRDNVTQ